MRDKMDLNVVARIRITPDSIDSDLNKIKDELARISSDYGKLHSAEIKPIAFGLNSLEAAILLNDSKGGIEEIEEKLKSVEGVSQVDVIDVNRL